MAATILLPTGERATLDRGEWTSETPQLADYIRAREVELGTPYYPDPEGNRAEAVARLLGAKVIAREPYDGDLPEGALP